MAVTYLDPLPVLKGEKAKKFIEETENHTAGKKFKLSKQEIATIKESMQF